MTRRFAERCGNKGEHLPHGRLPPANDRLRRSGGCEPAARRGTQLRTCAADVQARPPRVSTGKLAGAQASIAATAICGTNFKNACTQELPAHAKAHGKVPLDNCFSTGTDLSRSKTRSCLCGQRGSPTVKALGYPVCRPVRLPGLQSAP